MNWQNIIVFLIVAAAMAYAVTRIVRHYRNAKRGIVDCGCGCGANCQNCSVSKSQKPKATSQQPTANN